jgi:hypothetical protein
MNIKGFKILDENELQYNHRERLSFWLDKSRFVLFRGNILVDNYLAIDVNGSQFYPFAMCREYNSENYVSGHQSAYYLTTEEARSIVKYIDNL